MSKYIFVVEIGYITRPAIHKIALTTPKIQICNHLTIVDQAGQNNRNENQLRFFLAYFLLVIFVDMHWALCFYYLKKMCQERFCNSFIWHENKTHAQYVPFFTPFFNLELLKNLQPNTHTHTLTLNVWLQLCGSPCESTNCLKHDMCFLTQHIKHMTSL